MKKTHCDEIVVFHKSQTLPRFLIELEIELPYAPSDSPQFVNELIPHIMRLLQNPNVDRDEKLRKYLCIELEILLTLGGDDYLEEKHDVMYEKLKHILDHKGKVNRQVRCALTKTPHNIPVSPRFPQQIQSTTSLQNNLVSPQALPSKNSIPFQSNLKTPAKISLSTPSIAFGKTNWEKYFGDIGLEPPLPKNIEDILNASCSFWPNKKVKETHLLVLIPNTVNGKLFTMSYLGDLIQKPKFGYSTKYDYYSDLVKDALGDKSYPSHWVLMTRDVIPGSKGKRKSECCKMIANHSKDSGLPYALPHSLEITTSILMYYVKTGKKLYSNDPSTYAYSRDLDKSGAPMVIGGFASGGIDIYDNIYGGIDCGVAGCRVLC